MGSFWNGFKKQAELKDSVELKPHQTRTVNRLKTSPGVLVYHGLGSGKTLTSLAATQGIDTDVVVPASLRENYKKEVKKFTDNHNPNVMSYEKFIKEEHIPGGNLVVDEAHMLGRIESERAKKLIENADKYKKRILLTGTPVRNHPSELAPLLSVVRGDKEIPTDQTKFKEQYVKEITTNPNFFQKAFLGRTPSTTYDIKNQDKFRKLIKGFVDYHEGSVEDFPSVTTEEIKVSQTPEQKKMYSFMLDQVNPALRDKIRAGLPPSKQEAKQLNSFLTGVRQVSNSTVPFGGKEQPKIERAVEEIKKRREEDPNFKAVVYSNFVEAGIEPIAKKLDEEGITYGKFIGGISDKNRKSIINDYNTGKIKTLLISGAGSQGLDLKGTKLMQLLEPHWNSSRLDQAKGRAIRYQSHSHLPEKERNVHVQEFYSSVDKSLLDKIKGTTPLGVDEYLSTLSLRKDDLNNKFLNILKEEGGLENSSFKSGFKKQAGLWSTVKSWFSSKKEPAAEKEKKPPKLFYSKKLDSTYTKSINKAIKKASPINIKYTKADGSQVDRKVTPYTAKGKNVLIGFDHQRNAIRSFRVDRINALS